MLRIRKTLFTILIFVIAFLIRLINLDKVSGLWYDEMAIYSIASHDTFLGMVNSDINRFMVFPLYYTLYHC